MFMKQIIQKFIFFSVLFHRHLKAVCERLECVAYQIIVGQGLNNFFVMKFSKKKKRKNNRPQQHIPSGDNLQNLLLSCFSPTTTSDLFRNLKIGYQVLSLK